MKSMLEIHRIILVGLFVEVGEETDRTNGVSHRSAVNMKQS